MEFRKGTEDTRDHVINENIISTIIIANMGNEYNDEYVEITIHKRNTMLTYTHTCNLNELIEALIKLKEQNGRNN